MDVSSTPSVAQQEARRTWGWLLAFAILLIVLGLIVVNAPLLGVKAFVLLLGWLLIAGGVLQLVSAWVFRSFRSLGLELFFGALIMALGAILLCAPLTVGGLLALLVVGGLIADTLLIGFRALRARQPGWIWPLPGSYSPEEPGAAGRRAHAR